MTPHNKILNRPTTQYNTVDAVKYELDTNNNNRRTISHRATISGLNITNTTRSRPCEIESNRGGRRPTSRVLQFTDAASELISSTLLVDPRLKTLLGLYIVNANSFTKPHAIQQLHAELTGNNLSLAITTETHLKARHLPSAHQNDDFSIFRRDRMGRLANGVAVVVQPDLPATEHVFADDSPSPIYQT